MNATDTIAALATSPAPATRAIVRMSGADAFSIARDVAVGSAFPRHPAAFRGDLRLAGDDSLDVPALVLSFAAPRSSTGEDVVEFHLPGSPFFVGRLLARLFALGARQAEPGEFTARAFFNGRLDLAAAEGVVATIAASSRRELDAARQLLSGELARRLAPVMDGVAGTLALVEVGIDFTDEDVIFIARDDVITAIDEADAQLDRLLRESARFERIAHEPRIVLAGRPNAGKSTLLNALAASERAVVSDVAGTTRDALSARVGLASGFVTLVDVAGLDDANADDLIDAQMQTLARREIESADAVIYVREAGDDRPVLPLPRTPGLHVESKTDRAATSGDADAIGVSALTGHGMDALRHAMNDLAFGSGGSESGSTLALNVRHVEEIEGARRALRRARMVVDAGPEIVSLELRRALDHLGRILGKLSPDDVLGRIFSAFCIGK